LSAGIPAVGSGEKERENAQPFIVRNLVDFEEVDVAVTPKQRGETARLSREVNAPTPMTAPRSRTPGSCTLTRLQLRREVDALKQMLVETREHGKLVALEGDVTTMNLEEQTAALGARIAALEQRRASFLQRFGVRYCRCMGTPLQVAAR
jgi:hypothetical protein